VRSCIVSFKGTLVNREDTSCKGYKIKRSSLVQLLRDKIVRFLIKASNLAGLLTSVRQIFSDMEPCQILLQNHEMHMSKIWHTRPLQGNEADAKYQLFCLLGLLCLVSCYF